MENPAHDLITTERLPDREQEAALEHLNNASTQIQDIIEHAIREQDEADISNLTEPRRNVPGPRPYPAGQSRVERAHHHAKAATTSRHNR